MPESKPGIWSSEFWMVIVGVMVVILSEVARNAWDWNIDANAILALLGLQSVYTVGRTLNKNAIAKVTPPRV